MSVAASLAAANAAALRNAAPRTRSEARSEARGWAVTTTGVTVFLILAGIAAVVFGAAPLGIAAFGFAVVWGLAAAVSWSIALRG